MPFWQPCRCLSIGGRKFLCQLVKLSMRLFTYSKKTSSKCSSGYVEGSFSEHAELFLRIQFLWRKIQKQCWKYCFGRTSFSTEYSSAHAECNFDNAAEKIDKNLNFFRSNSAKSYTNKEFPQKKSFHEKTSPVT